MLGRAEALEGFEYWYVCVWGGGGGQTFRWLLTDRSPLPQSVPNNYISHIENW